MKVVIKIDLKTNDEANFVFWLLIYILFMIIGFEIRYQN